MSQIVNLRDYRRLKMNIAKHLGAYVAFPVKQNRLLIEDLTRLAGIKYGVKKMKFPGGLVIANGEIIKANMGFHQGDMQGKG